MTKSTVPSGICFMTLIQSPVMNLLVKSLGYFIHYKRILSFNFSPFCIFSQKSSRPQKTGGTLYVSLNKKQKSNLSVI